MADEEPMATAAELSKRLSIPISTVYWLAKTKQITSHESLVGWRKKRRLHFLVSEVVKELNLDTPR